MLKSLSTLIVLFLSLPVWAQVNLIPNNSFENFDTCGTVIFNYEMDNVWGPALGLNLDSCWSKVGPVQLEAPCNGSAVIAYDGEASISFNNTSDNTAVTHYRDNEKLAIELKESIHSGQEYYIEYWIKSYPLFVVDVPYFRNTGVYFSNNLDFNLVGNTLDKPIHFADTTTIIDTLSWKKISGCFTVDSTYKYLVGFTLANDGYHQMYGDDEYFTCSYLVDKVTLTPIDTFLTIATSQDTICAGDCVTISTNHSLIDAVFNWDLPGSSYNGADTGFVTVCYQDVGSYDIGVDVTHCVGSYDHVWPDQIVVIAIPNQTAPDYDTIVLVEGQTLEIGCADSGPVTWPLTEGLILNGLTATVTDAVLEDTIYSCIFGDTTQCGFECRYVFRIQHYPQAIFEMDDDDVCLGDCINISNQSAYSDIDYTYILDDVFHGPVSGDLQICPEEIGTHNLSLIAHNALGQDTLTYDLVVRPYPEVDVVQENTITIVQGDSIMLFNPFNISTSWTSSNTVLDCLGCDTLIVYGTNSTQIVAQASIYPACSIQESFTINVTPKIENIFLPTAFSPNNDGINDYWQPYHTTGIEIKGFSIFNRWGDRVFVSTSETPTWDGYAGNQLSMLGVYVVFVEYIDEKGVEQIAKGDITLIY